jgi:hypothetical protein
MSARPAAVQWALVLGAIVQCALYLALWRHLATSVPGAPDTSDLHGTPYKVVTEDGAVHLIAVDSPDPARPLTEAMERFEKVVSIRRIDPTEAMTVLREQRRSHLWVLILFVFPVTFLLLAARIKARAERLAQVLEAIAPTLSVDIESLARTTGLTRGRLRADVGRLRQFGLDELQWDEARGRIYDARLSAYNLTLQFCPHCNDPIHVRVRADLTSVGRCPNCMTVFDTAALARMNEDLVERLLADSATRASPPSFSFAAFALCTLVLPPAALLLAWRSGG